MKSFSFAALLASGLCMQYAAAATLYIPLLDPQPITADIEGVDSSGHTTWRIGPGVPSGTLTEDSGLFTSATLIAGPTDIQLIENDTELGFAITADCGVSGGIAVCTVAASADSIVSTTIATETAIGFDVQVAATAAVAGEGPSSTGAATPSPTATGSGATPAPSSPTGSGSAAPSATGGSNGAGRAGLSVFAGVVSFVLVFVQLS